MQALSLRIVLQEIAEFNDWLGTLPHRYKVVIAGNHDLLFDHTFYNDTWRKWVDTKEHCEPLSAAALLTNATHYLEHNEVGWRSDVEFHPACTCGCMCVVCVLPRVFSVFSVFVALLLVTQVVRPPCWHTHLPPRFFRTRIM